MTNCECHYYISINQIDSNQYERSIDKSNTEDVEDELLTKCIWLRHSCIDFYVTRTVFGACACACGFFFLNLLVQCAVFTSNKLRNEPFKFGLKRMDPQIVQPENCQRFAVNRATHKAIKTVNHINRITSTRQFSCSLTKNELDLGFFLFQWNAIVVFMLHEVLAYKF